MCKYLLTFGGNYCIIYNVYLRLQKQRICRMGVTDETQSFKGN